MSRRICWQIYIILATPLISADQKKKKTKKKKNSFANKKVSVILRAQNVMNPGQIPKNLKILYSQNLLPLK